MKLSQYVWFQRVDLGECTKVHEYALRADYERAAGSRNLYYEIDVSRVREEKIPDD